MVLNVPALDLFEGLEAKTSENRLLIIKLEVLTHKVIEFFVKIGQLISQNQGLGKKIQNPKAKSQWPTAPIGSAVVSESKYCRTSKILRINDIIPASAISDWRSLLDDPDPKSIGYHYDQFQIPKHFECLLDYPVHLL